MRINLSLNCNDLFIKQAHYSSGNNATRKYYEGPNTISKGSICQIGQDLWLANRRNLFYQLFVAEVCIIVAFNVLINFKNRVHLSLCLSVIIQMWRRLYCTLGNWRKSHCWSKTQNKQIIDAPINFVNNNIVRLKLPSHKNEIFVWRTK